MAAWAASRNTELFLMTSIKPKTDKTSYPGAEALLMETPVALMLLPYLKLSPSKQGQHTDLLLLLLQILLAAFEIF